MRKKTSFLICDLLDDNNCDRRRNDDFGQSPVSSESSCQSHDHRFNYSIASSDRADAVTPDLKRNNFDDNLFDDKSENSLKKNRKSRTIFTDKQLQALEECFDKQKYLSVQDRLDLARRLRLSDTQVKTWYQNRRTKWKRQSAVGYELLNEAANCMAVQQMLQANPGYWSYLAAAGALNPADCPPPGSLLSTTPCKAPPAAAIPQHTSFCFYPPTEENHYPTVAMPPPVKSILTVDNTVATSVHC